MNYVKNVYELAESVMEDSQYVTINETKIKEYSEFLITINYPEPFECYSKAPETEVLIELVSTSIDYCFWYGKPTIRPNGCGSQLLYELIYDIFLHSHQSISVCLNKLIKTLITMRFPLVEYRIKHLKEVEVKAEQFVSYIIDNHDKEPLNDMISYLICTFPGFAEDLFLKRTCLFFIQLFRKLRWYKEEMFNFLVPADYQLPKVMFHHGLISYSPSLESMILSHQLIPKGSLQEIEIRAATILTAKKLSEFSGWNIADIDTTLFLQRKFIDVPFHLTITTDY